MVENLEKKLGPLILHHEMKLAVAESCTAGLLCDRITNNPGSSSYFLGGIIAYADDIKVRILGVQGDTLHTYGAVSKEVVIEMAQGVKHIFKADLGLSTSGIAGPGGGTSEKPVGTTWIGLATPEGVWARFFSWEGSRRQNKDSTADAGLQFLLEFLRGDINK